MSFSSKLSRPNTSLRMSSSASPVISTSFTTMSLKSTIWLQPSFVKIQEYEQIVAYPLKRAANDLVLSDKSCLELRKSERRTTTETGITASCLITRNNSSSLLFTMSTCRLRIVSPKSSSQHWYNWRSFLTLTTLCFL